MRCAIAAGHKLAEDYDPSDRIGAINHLQERRPLGDTYLCPGSEALDALNASLR